MPNSLDISGERFRLVIEDFSGGLNSEGDPSAIAANEFVTLKNVLINRPGPARKRGAMVASTGAVITAAATRYIGGSDYAYIAATQSAPGGTSAITTAHRATSGASTNLGTSLQNTLCSPTNALGVNINSEQMVFCSDVTLETGFEDPDTFAIANTASTVLTTGTVTLPTANTSASIVGSGTGWTSSVVGAFFIATNDTSATKAVYRILSVNTGTQTLTLDRVYAGSDAGASKAYRITAISKLYVTPGTFVSAASSNATDVRAGTCASAWSRLVFGNVDVPGAAEFKPNRLRWSGVIGLATEGTSPYTGMNGYHAGGYLDLPASFGTIKAIVPSGSAVVVFMTQGIVVLYGSPTFSTAGSLDQSTTFPGYQVLSEMSVCETPYGMFFFDEAKGLCQWDLNGRPEPIGDNLFTSLRAMTAPSLGYYRDHLFIRGASASYLYNIPNETFVEISPGFPSHFFEGRNDGSPSTSHYLFSPASGTGIINVANIIDNPGIAATDYSGTAITTDIKTGLIGDHQTLLRPHKWRVTYKATDLTTTNPTLTLTVSTGEVGSQNSVSSSALLESLTVTTTHGVVAVARDSMLQVRALQTNGAGVYEIHRIVVEGQVIGDGNS